MWWWGLQVMVGAELQSRRLKPLEKYDQQEILCGHTARELLKQKCLNFHFNLFTFLSCKHLSLSQFSKRLLYTQMLGMKDPGGNQNLH